MEEEKTWEMYGLTEEEWNLLSEEQKQSYLGIGQEENSGEGE